MPNPNELLKNILTDMRVELTEMFDRNFERKAFFDKRWEPRKYKQNKGSLLHITGKMRRSIRPAIRGREVKFTSSVPYTELHNTGGKFTQTVRPHSRKVKRTGKTHSVRSHARTMTMPQRQFIGDHPDVRKAIKSIINENITDFFNQLSREIKK